MRPGAGAPFAMTYQPPQPTLATSPAKAAVDPYLRTRVLTATPEQLQLMLFDGAIRFAEQGRAGLEAKQFDVSYERLQRAQHIVSELQVTLREEHDADNCKRLRALYTFVYLRLVDANIEHEVKAVDDAGQSQPEDAADVWNFAGYLSTAWHRVTVDAVADGG